MTTLILEEISSGGTIPLIELSGGDKVIGRDPTVDIVIPTSGVSRVHGGFLEVQGRWLYRDLRSTNGSWLNGVRLRTEAWQLIRDSDLMQIGDAAIRLRLVDGPPLSEDPALAELIVVRIGGAVDIFKFGENEDSKVLVVNDGVISIVPDLSRPGPTVSFLNQALVVNDPSGQLTKLDNTLAGQSTFVLHDREGLSIGETQLVLDCYPPMGSPEETNARNRELGADPLGDDVSGTKIKPAPQLQKSDLLGGEDEGRFSSLSKVERGRSSQFNLDLEPIGPETQAIDTAELRAQFARVERRPTTDRRSEGAGSGGLGDFVRGNPFIVLVTMAFFMCLGVLLALLAAKYLGM